MSVDDLLLRYFAGEANGEDLAALERALEDRSVRARLVTLAHDEAAIGSWFREHEHPAEATGESPGSGGGSAATSAHRRMISARHRRRRSRQNLSVLMIACVGFVVAVGLIVAVLFTQKTSSLSPQTNQILTDLGSVEVLPAPGALATESTQAASSWRISSGTVTSERQLHNAHRLTDGLYACSTDVLLSASDSSILALTAGTQFSFTNGIFHVDVGHVNCQITPGKQGFKIHTPSSVITVIGTAYQVAVDDFGTTTTVDEGVVSMQLRKTGDRISIPAGHWAHSEDLDFQAHPIAPGGVTKVVGLLPVDSSNGDGSILTQNVIDVDNGHRHAFLVITEPIGAACFIRFPEDQDNYRFGRKSPHKPWLAEYMHPIYLFGDRSEGPRKVIVPREGITAIIQPVDIDTMKPSGPPRQVHIH